ncbi:hypothetical protein AB9F29_17215 [Falsihalocynthiibacter sp. S25ZX9]|uniref:hypothetical protein n=1 Tax=Falsihalocynthiibacter sp. S25ZX9 TaxID=3240870 RepID=UPI00350F0075
MKSAAFGAKSGLPTFVLYAAKIGNPPLVFNDTNGPKPTFTTISNAAAESTEADIDALSQHY